ncbi:MAG: aspartate/glutamate racemase family protein [Pseudomonadota bacterium]
MTDRHVYLINPNSSETVTEAMARAVAHLPPGDRLRCVTSKGGPLAIESSEDAEAAIPPMVALARELEATAGAFVIACFSDPGLEEMRATFDVPVFGIRDCATATAMTLGARFGVVAILENSVTRQRDAFGRLGLTPRWAGSRALGLGVAELADPATAEARVLETGHALRHQDGADVLILGCAGMSGYRQALADATGLPVVDPTQAAAAMALGHMLSHGASGSQ